MDVDVDCEEGLCRPRRAGLYQDTCKEICGYSSCLNAVKDIDPCDVSKPCGFWAALLSEKTTNTYLCLNGKNEFCLLLI